MHEQAITSLAILKVNWDRNHDYIQNFVPFVADCLRESSNPEVSLQDLQTLILQNFGLVIPQGALKTILARAARKNYVKRAHGIYRRNDRALSKINLAPLRTEVLRKYEAFIQKLIQFAKDSYQLQWSDKDAEDALLAFLADNSAYVLAAAVQGQLIPAVASAHTTKQGEYIVRVFIVHTCEKDPDGFAFLEMIIKGNMLANVLVFPDLGSIERHFDQTRIYFDTTFLLRALGLAGASLQTPCRELLDLLYELNGRLACFKHTYDEIEGVLRAAANVLQEPRNKSRSHPETIEFLVRSGYTASDVELVIAGLEKRIRALRVEIVEKPPMTTALSINEVKLEDLLRDQVRYHREDALRRDVDSVTAIHRLRNGQFPLHIEASNAVFVTTNSPLARNCTQFFRDEYESVPVPHCILDYVLTTIVWLKRPLRAPELPRKKIIADCYAAMNPDDGLWRSYLHEIERLRQRSDISETDYHLLRYSADARRLLVDITLGDVDAFVEGTVQEILERAQTEIRAEAEDAQRIAEEKMVQAEEKAAKAEVQRDFFRQAQLERIQFASGRIAYWLSRSALVSVFIVIALGIYMTFPAPFPQLPNKLFGFVAPGLFLFMGVLTLISTIYGTTIMAWIRRLEILIANFSEKHLTRWFVP